MPEGVEERRLHYATVQKSVSIQVARVPNGLLALAGEVQDVAVETAATVAGERAAGVEFPDLEDRAFDDAMDDIRRIVTDAVERIREIDELRRTIENGGIGVMLDQEETLSALEFEVVACLLYLFFYDNRRARHLLLVVASYPVAHR